MVKLNLERLLQLMEQAGPETSAVAVLERWKSEHDRAVAEQQERAVQAARDNPTRYGVKRVEEAYQEAAGTYLRVWKSVEHFDVAVDELPKFAKYIGCRLEELQQLVEGRRPELILRTGLWRAWTTPRWSASRDYVDRTQQEEDRAELLREDEETRAWVQAMNEHREHSIKPEPAWPLAVEWRYKQ